MTTPIATVEVRSTPIRLLDIIERVTWTFAQAFFGALASSQLISLPNVDGAKKLLGSAFAAGVAAAMSAVKNITLRTASAPAPLPVIPSAPLNGPMQIDGPISHVILHPVDPNVPVS